MTSYSGSMNGPGYTLGTEWQLYILMLPFLLVARRWGWAALVLVLAASALPIPGAPGKLTQKVLSTTFTIPFVLGILSARFALTSSSSSLPGFLRHDRVLSAVLGGGVVLGAIGFLVLNNAYYDLGCWAASLSTGCGCILMTRHPTSLGTRVFGSRIARAVGSFAYSLYLTHFPLLAVIAFIAVRLGVEAKDAFYLVMLPSIPIVFGFAYVFYLIFERPFLHYRRKMVVAAPVTRRIGNQIEGLAVGQ
jgi:peptidoglycan/LPS O-acetylase OafA/YrhL